MVDWQRVEEGLALVVEVDEADRDAWLADFCADDAELRGEIESLLAFESDAGSFLEKTAGHHVAALLDSAESDVAGRVFGNYEIIRELGHGGMGAVYLARRTDGEFEQEVALKIVRQSIAERQMVERFRRERQILASLNHPNIAKLLDGGISASGEPYLAMEYVEGGTITEFVGQNRPSITSILNLFIKVCSAVGYAHRNLVVHRDIKPGNILVTPDGEPKLLDFGLAKLVDEGLASDSQTQTAFRALTPAYASPEQLRNEPMTTSTDVYSLGVLLYELLTGERPFRFDEKPFDQIIQTVSERDPKPPSAVRDASSGLKGDLDNIILKALRKEPDRRYSSVSEFGDDIGRYLKGLPVSARPHTFRYRAGKFIKRHRIGVAAGLIVLISLISGIGVSVWQARVARAEKVKAQAVSGFLESMLASSAPNSSLRQKKNDLTVKDVLDEASRRLATSDLNDQPDVKARLQQIIGSSYLSVGQYDPAEQNLSSAFETQLKLHGEEDDETLQTMVVLAALWVAKGENEKANNFYERRLSVLRSEQKSGRISSDFLLTALSDFALLRRGQGDSKTAENLLREGIALRPLLSDESKISLGITEAVLALTLADQGKFAEAESIIREKLDTLRASVNPESPDIAANLTGLGSFVAEQGRYDEAMESLVKAEEIYRKANAPMFLALGDNLRLQAQNLYFLGRFPEAESKLTEALTIYRASTSQSYVNHASALTIQGMIFMKTGRVTEAESVLRDAVKTRGENLPKNHYLTALTRSALGECLTIQNKLGEAEPLLVESFESLKSSQGGSNPRTVLAHERLIRLYRQWNKPEMTARYLN